MSDPSGTVFLVTLDEIEDLGRELSRLRWDHHLRLCRKLWVQVRYGRPLLGWTLQHAARIASVVGRGPAPMPEGEGECPTCPERQAGEPWAGVRTMMNLPDRHVNLCAKCGTEWVVVRRGDGRGHYRGRMAA